MATEFAATKWRNDVAMGVSPWNRNPQKTVSPKGTTGNLTQPTHVAASKSLCKTRRLVDSETNGGPVSDEQAEHQPALAKRI